MGGCEVLGSGGIVAVKGLGGFHLACNAGSAKPVALSRARKGRLAKPLCWDGFFADLAAVTVLAEAQAALLADPAAPVVLVASRRVLPEGVAPGMATLA